MTERRASTPKYRIPGDAPGVALTPDDDQILREVFRHDIIDADAVYTLLSPRSEDKVRRRLRKLFDNKYLDRLGQLEQVFVPGGGSLPIAYTLGPRGIARLREAFGLRVRSNRYRDRSRSLSTMHVRHALEQSRFLVQCRMASERQEHIDFLYTYDIFEQYAPALLDLPKQPTAVTGEIEWFNYVGRQSTIPDGLFMLRYKNRPEGNNRRSLFVEIDRGTETIDVSERKAATLAFWKDSSLLRKFLVYSFAWKQKTHVKTFGIPTFQVLTVTTSADRISKIQQMFHKRLASAPVSAHPARFLFTDFETINRYGGDIFTAPIVDADGKERPLL